MLYTPAGYTQEFSKTLNQINKNRIKVCVLIPTFTNKPETFFTVSETFYIFGTLQADQTTKLKL